MKCPACHVADNDKVIDTRAIDDGVAIRRRRHCLSCNHRFTTYERVERTIFKVIKKDGGRVPFQRDRFKRGLERACWKRPVSDAQLDRIVLDVENQIETRFDGEVDSHFLGEMAMQHLRKIDQVAYVRFASVYREFKDVRDFVDELRPMLIENNRADKVAPR
jgi:transcriptional repressor NrdR